jgi:aspartyl-tRNA(Asn)/glutamyl-tRNA(Gln) amidotransferase subunit C
MAVTKEQVSHLGWLSRLDLSEEEIERYAGQIEQIIKYLDKLDSMSLTDAEAVSIEKDISELRDDIPVEFDKDPFGTTHRKDGYVKGPRMT